MLLLCNSERDPDQRHFGLHANNVSQHCWIDILKSIAGHVDVWILNSSLILCNSLGTKGKIVSGKRALELKAGIPTAIQNHKIIMTIMIGNINKWLDICGKSDWRGILLNSSLQETFPNCCSKQN